MNDYFAGRLARERQADYIREVEHDELVAQAHRTEAKADAHRLVAHRQVLPFSLHLELRRLLAHVAPIHLTIHGRRS